jgi:Hpt domain
MLSTKEILAQKLELLKQEYLIYLKTWQNELMFLEDRYGSWSVDDINQLQVLVHKLSGTGTTYGFPEITKASQTLDYKLSIAKEKGSDANQHPDIKSDLRKLIEICIQIKA